MDEGRMQRDPPCLTLEGWTLIMFKATLYHFNGKRRIMEIQIFHRAKI
jgi:hypothetical protein